MYIMNYIDRNALPHARVQGLEEDLGLEGVQYNVVLSVTFIGYILMQGTILSHAICETGLTMNSSEQYGSQLGPTQLVPGNVYGCLGCRQRCHSCSPGFWWSYCVPLLPGSHRGMLLWQSVHVS